MSKKAEPLASKIADRYHAWRDEIEPWLADWAEIDEMARGTWESTAEKIGAARTSSLEMHRNIEGVVSAVQAVTFSDEPYFMLGPNDLQEGAVRRSEVSQAVLEKQFRLGGVRKHYRNFLRDWTTYGTGIGSAHWLLDERWVAAGRGKEPKAKAVRTMDLTAFRRVPLWRFAFDPGGEAVNGERCCEWVIEERDMTESEITQWLLALKKFARGDVKDPEKIDFTSEPTETVGSEEAERQKRKLGYTQPSRGRHRVWFYWGLNPNESNPPINWLIAIMDETTWLCKVQNIYPHGWKPYVASSFLAQHESLLGWGIGHLLRASFKEIVERQDLMQDIINLAIYGVIIQRGGIMGFDQITMRPGMVLNAAHYGELDFQRPELTGIAPAQNLNTMRKEEMRGSSGATNTIQSIPTDVTATEVRADVTEASRRIADLATIAADEALRPFIVMAHENNLKLMDRNMLVEIMGDNDAPQQIMASRKDLVPDPDVTIRLALDLDNRYRTLRNMNQTTAQFLQAIEIMPEVKEILRPLLERAAWLNNVRVKLPRTPGASPEMVRAIAEREVQLARGQTEAPPAAPTGGMQ